MLKLEVVTPERRVFDADVDSVTIPTASGEAGILPNHAPLISALKPGILSVSFDGKTEKMAIAGGFVEVSSNQVSVLTDIAETSDEINVEDARREKQEAEQALAAVAASALDETESERERLDKANIRLQLAGK